MKTRLLAVLLVSSLALVSAAAVAFAQDDRKASVQYVDCSQVQNAIASQYGNAIADGRDSSAEVAQDLNISQNQVNACLGNVGVQETTEKTEKTEEKTEEKSEQERSGEETTVVDGRTIIIPKGVAADELPDTGGPTGGGYLLAAGCALLGAGLIVNRIIR